MLVSLISGGSGYLQGAKALAASLQKHEPTVPRLLLVEDKCYNDKQIQSAETAGWNIKIVPPVHTIKVKFKAERWPRTFSKLHVWNIETKRLIYLDADCFVLKPFYEKLIHRHIINVGACWVARDSKRFNAGVMLLEPNPVLWEQMISDVREKPDSITNVSMSDQGYLNTIFQQWTQIPDKFNYRWWKRKPGDLHIAHLRPHPWTRKPDNYMLPIYNQWKSALTASPS